MGTDGAANNWDPSPDGDVTCLVSTGGILRVGGAFTHVSGSAQTQRYVAAFDSSGNLITNWNPSPDGVVLALAVDGGTVYAGGRFRNFTVGTQTFQRNYLAAFDGPSGALVDAWNPSPNAEIDALAASGGSVYVGGLFTSFTVGTQTTQRHYLAAIDASGNATAWDPSANASVLSLAVTGNAAYAGGSFTGVGNATRNGLAAFGAKGGLTSWDPNAGVGGVVYTLLIDEGTIYVGGGAGQGFTLIGGQPRANLAAIDGSGTAIATWNPGANNDVSAIVANGDAVWVAGSFDTIQGQARKYLASIYSTTSVTPGVATSWVPNPDASVRSLVLDSGILYVGGEFANVAASGRSRLAAFDAMNQLTPWNPAADGPVTAIAVTQGTVYVGGTFANVGGQPRSAIAAVGASGNGDVAVWNPGAYGPSSTVVRALSATGSSIDAGGLFTRINSSLLANYARLER